MAEVDNDEIREHVRERYAAAASAMDAGAPARCGAGDAAASCCAPGVGTTDAAGNEIFGASPYDADDAGPALSASLGCAVPTAVADLSDGDVVLDLGSGAGGDVLLSARRVAPSGHAIGLDMTDEMLALARRNAADAGVGNVEFVKRYLEELPLPDASVDVIISNCVINLSGDKPRVLREAAHRDRGRPIASTSTRPLRSSARASRGPVDEGPPQISIRQTRPDHAGDAPPRNAPTSC